MQRPPAFRTFVQWRTSEPKPQLSMSGTPERLIARLRTPESNSSLIFWRNSSSLSPIISAPRRSRTVVAPDFRMVICTRARLWLMFSFGQESLIDFRDDDVIGIDHFRQANTRDFGKKFVRVEIAQAVVMMNPVH